MGTTWKKPINFEGIVSGVTTSGEFNDTTTSMGAGTSTDLEISLPKGNYAFAWLKCVEEEGVYGSGYGSVIFCTTDSAISAAVQTGPYGGFWHKVAGAFYLSDHNSIRIVDAYIDNVNNKIIINVLNSSASTRTVSINIVWSAYQS